MAQFRFIIFQISLYILLMNILEMTWEVAERNIVIQTCSSFRQYHDVLHGPRQDSQSGTLVLADPLNQKVEHHIIKWEQLSFPSHWLFEAPKGGVLNDCNFEEYSTYIWVIIV